MFSTLQSQASKSFTSYTLVSFQEKLSFSNVSFRYSQSTPYVFKDLNPVKNVKPLWSRHPRG